jgi:phosphate starvation-inducible PhoH-like protein
VAIAREAHIEGLGQPGKGGSDRGQGSSARQRAGNNGDSGARGVPVAELIDRMERGIALSRGEVVQPALALWRSDRGDGDSTLLDPHRERRADATVLVVQHKLRFHARRVLRWSSMTTLRAPCALVSRDPSRASGSVSGDAYTGSVQDVITVPNEVAAELAGVTDGVLATLRERLGCAISLRGNRLTLDGEDDDVVAARAVVDELVELVEGGHPIGPETVGAVVVALDQAEHIRDVLEDVVWSHRGKKIAPKTVTQRRYVEAIRGSTVTFGIGPAGTGKTYLAIALAVSALAEKRVGRIILTRPAVEAGERLGFLPGDLAAKVDPYMRPLFDALYDTMDPDRLNAYIDRGTIEVAPLAFMRGRTLNDSFIILDEAQNTTPEQMQMFLTRLGFGSRMVVTGDVTQIDLPREQASGLIQVRNILTSIDGIGFVEFGHEDVVRHKLVQRIVEAYKRHVDETGNARRH